MDKYQILLLESKLLGQDRIFTFMHFLYGRSSVSQGYNDFHMNMGLVANILVGEPFYLPKSLWGIPFQMSIWDDYYYVIKFDINLLQLAGLSP